MALEGFTCDPPLTIELVETWLTPDHEDADEPVVVLGIIKDLLDGNRVDLALPFLERLAEMVDDLEEVAWEYLSTGR